MKNIRILSLLVSVTCFGLSVGPLTRVLKSRNADYFWTNVNNKEGFRAGNNLFELYVTGDRFEQLLRDGQLLVKKNGETIRLVEADVKLRINRYHEATKMDLFYSGVLLTLSAVSLLFFIGTLMRRAAGSSGAAGD